MSERGRQLDELRKQSPELATLFDAIRNEFDAKISGLKAWGVAMCLGGGAIGGFVAELLRPGVAAEAASLLPFV